MDLVLVVLAVAALIAVILSFMNYPNWDILHKVATLLLAIDLIIFFLR